MNVEDIWKKSLLYIEKKIGNNIIELWFRPIKLSHVKDKSAIIVIPNRFFKDWIEDNYPDIIAEAIENIIGNPITIRYKTEEKVDPVVKKADIQLENRRQKLTKKGIHLNPRYTFDNYIIGPSNQFAQAAAKAVADTPVWEWAER